MIKIIAVAIPLTLVAFWGGIGVVIYSLL